jgi:galactose mutarotase-like enzyme
VTDHVLRADDAALTVSPGNGGRLVSLRVGDLEVLGRGGSRLVDWGSYAMVPYAGRVRAGRLTWDGVRHQLAIQAPPHAMHGVTLDRSWDVVDATERSLTLRCAFDSRWPWAGHALQHVELTGDSALARLEVHAERDAMPAWCGFHPWFLRRLGRGAPVTIALHAGAMLRRDGEGMPTHEGVAVAPGPWDDCFVDVRWPVTLRWPDALELTVSSDGGYVVVFDAKPGAVCVEPQTAPPNAAELGLAATVTPDAPLSLTMHWAWRLL